MLTYMMMVCLMFIVLTVLLVRIVVHNVTEDYVLNVDTGDFLTVGTVMFLMSLMWPITALALACMSLLWVVWKLTNFYIRNRVWVKR